MTDKDHDDRLLPSLLLRAMDEGLKLRNELLEAEAAQRRIQSEALAAQERVELARERYETNRTYAMDVWGTLKDDFTRPHDHDADPAAATQPPAAGTEGGE